MGRRVPPRAPLVNVLPMAREMQQALLRHFGFSSFLEGQEAVITHVLEGGDVLVIMPTGAGKSLCYQLSAMLMEGVTLVVSPLIALMKDQVDGLAARGVPATFINSSLPVAEMHERIAGMTAGRYKLVYVAPERFRVPSFAGALERVPVSLLAVDEAHCISRWGHDFRPDYTRLHLVVERLPRVRVMALTATATPHVREDIIRQLRLGEGERGAPKVLVHGFARPNLHLRVHQTHAHRQKLACIENTLKRFPTGIVYCATRKQTERVYEKLAGPSARVGLYHAGLQPEARQATQENFMAGDLDVVVATNAFGMGVDRADLRFVIHWDVPGSIEAYYQEIGRAGRDGEVSRCELLFNYADVRTQEFFIEGANPTRAQVEAVWDTVRTECNRNPATWSIAEWTRRVGVTRNEMTVRTVMGLLERAGLIHREMVGGERTYKTALVEGADLAVLEEQFPYLEEKRRRDERMLKDMLRYASTPKCRHAYILNYFGERDIEEPCGACDHCVRSRDADARRPTEEEWIVIQKILSCAGHMKGRFGRARMAQVLMGSREPALRERGLDELSTYGVLREYPQAYVRGVLDELIRDGSLALSEEEYPVVELTARGREVMWKKADIRLRWPERKGGAGPSRPRAGKRDQTPERYDLALFEALKRWRLEAARSEGVPAYVVMHDATLKAIAGAAPNTLAELERMKGMGPSRVTRYGNAILEVIDTHRSSQSVE